MNETRQLHSQDVFPCAKSSYIFTNDCTTAHQMHCKQVGWELAQLFILSALSGNERIFVPLGQPFSTF